LIEKKIKFYADAVGARWQPHKMSLLELHQSDFSSTLSGNGNRSHFEVGKP
jgi:hypothetical protein